jgi:hypothetical protein
MWDRIATTINLRGLSIVFLYTFPSNIFLNFHTNLEPVKKFETWNFHGFENVCLVLLGCDLHDVVI